MYSFSTLQLRTMYFVQLIFLEFSTQSLRHRENIFKIFPLLQMFSIC